MLLQEIRRRRLLRSICRGRTSTRAPVILDPPRTKQVFLTLVLAWNADTIATEDAFSGFNSAGVLAVGFLFAVIRDVERSRLSDKATKHAPVDEFVISLVGVLEQHSRRRAAHQLSRETGPSPVACLFGGLTTIMGTSTTLVVQGLVIDAGKKDPVFSSLA